MPQKPTQYIEHLERTVSIRVTETQWTFLEGQAGAKSDVSHVLRGLVDQARSMDGCPGCENEQDGNQSA